MHDNARHRDAEGRGARSERPCHSESHRQIFILRAGHEARNPAPYQMPPVVDILEQELTDASTDSYQVILLTSWEGFEAHYDEQHVACLVVMADQITAHLLGKLAQHSLTLPQIVVTGETAVERIVATMRAGVCNLLPATCVAGDLAMAIVEALRPADQALRRRQYVERVRARAQQLSSLDRRILKAISAGVPSRVIAASNQIGLRTVESHRAKIHRTMQSGSAQELLRMVYVAELFDGEDAG